MPRPDKKPKRKPNRYYLKHKGGDPRNHTWREVTEYDFDKANKENFFKKEIIDAEQRSEKQEKKSKKIK